MDTFRLSFALILIAAVAISTFFRSRARRSEAIPRAREGKGLLLLRLAVALPFLAGLVAYAVEPRWMAWSAVPLPPALRWAGVGVGLASLGLLLWIFRAIGPNISETVLTKSDHQLVTHGPYRWVRHPLYTVATAALLSLGLIAANAFILLVGLLLFAGIALVIVPREEAQLIDKFGDSYRQYRRRSGAFLPRP